jgi:hypothetical protein
MILDACEHSQFGWHIGHIFLAVVAARKGLSGARFAERQPVVVLVALVVESSGVGRTMEHVTTRAN